MIRLTRHVYAHCLHWISSSIALTAQSCSCCTVYTICHCRSLVVAVRPGTGQFKLPGRFELRTPSDETYRQKKVIRLKKLLFVFFIQTYCWIPQRRHRNSDTTRIGVHRAALWLSLSLLPPIHHFALAWLTQPPPFHHWDDACLSRSRCCLPHICVCWFLPLLFSAFWAVRDLLFVVFFVCIPRKSWYSCLRQNHMEVPVLGRSAKRWKLALQPEEMTINGFCPWQEFQFWESYFTVSLGAQKFLSSFLKEPWRAVRMLLLKDSIWPGREPNTPKLQKKNFFEAEHPLEKCNGTNLRFTNFGNMW